MRVWVVLLVGVLAFFIGVNVLFNVMRASSGIRELDYREEKRILPDVYYCSYVVADADYERVFVLVETVDYRGVRVPHYLVFVIQLGNMTTKCMPPANYYFEMGGKQVWAGEGDGILHSTIELPRGHYVIVLAQTDNLAGMTTVRITLQGSTRVS